MFARSPAFDGAGPWIVVGLANPGKRYERTRHNVGGMVLEILLERAGGRLKRHKSGCLVSEIALSGERAVLARPTSFMNESGLPVRDLLRWYKAVPEKLIAIHDDLDIPFGQVRVKLGGGTAGHHGLDSLVAHLRTKEFVRVRVGVSRPRGEAVDYVLGEFSGAERKELPFVLERAADAVERVVASGTERAMNEYNTR